MLFLCPCSWQDELRAAKQTLLDQYETKMSELLHVSIVELCACQQWTLTHTHTCASPCMLWSGPLASSASNMKLI